ncbi:hypothetical protein KVO79_24550 [Serratia quinivorans]|uniref:hypothetical protein n=1 Tax=Serratia quinivorans TaxID=137545 RepID=UPI001C473145|nr:hypothetical protein [Serratia quinivorans]MBV6695268.1 hypothetical protein [Serratia quinivorans]
MKHDTDYYMDKILKHDRHNNKVEAWNGLVIIVTAIFVCLFVFIFKDITFIVLSMGLIIFSFLIVKFNSSKKVESSSTVFTMFGDCAEDKEFCDFFIPLFDKCFLIGRKEFREVESFISLREKRLTDIKLREIVLKAINGSNNDE